MTMTTPRERLVERIRGEYAEMPGLRLTLAQAARLWQLDVAICETLLQQLALNMCLRKMPDGAYIASSGSHQAQARIRRDQPLRRSA